MDSTQRLGGGEEMRAKTENGYRRGKALASINY